MKKVLANKLYLMTFVADLISDFGDVLYYLALMNYVLVLPDTRLALSLITLSETIPILTGLFMGVWADRTKNKLDTISATLVVRIVLYLLVGLVMGFPPALWVVALVCLFNLVSDMAGQYDNYLFMPVSLRLIANEDREATSAFRQAISAILQIIFRSSGAVLIGWMTYQQLAFFNAGTFALSLVIMLGLRPALGKLFVDQPIEEKEQENSGQVWGQLRQSLRESYEVVKGIPIIQSATLLLAALNAVFVSLSPIMLLCMKEDSSFIIENTAITIAISSAVYLTGSILGSFLTTNLFKNLSILQILKAGSVFSVLIFLSFYLHLVYLVFLFVFCVAVLAGVLMPKFNALIYRTVSEDKLATVSAGISTAVQLGMIVMRGVLAILLVSVSSSVISMMFLLLSLLLLVYTIRKIQVEVEDESK